VALEEDEEDEKLFYISKVTGSIEKHHPSPRTRKATNQERA
jgi:hypothetical protein